MNYIRPTYDNRPTKMNYFLKKEILHRKNLYSALNLSLKEIFILRPRSLWTGADEANLCVMLLFPALPLRSPEKYNFTV